MNKVVNAPKNTSKYTIEANYISSDGDKQGSYYHFPYNAEFTAIHSPKKAIGYRYCDINTNTSARIAANFINPNIVDMTGNNVPIPIDMYIEPDNNIYVVTYNIKLQCDNFMANHPLKYKTNNVKQYDFAIEVYIYKEESNNSLNVGFVGVYEDNGLVQFDIKITPKNASRIQEFDNFFHLYNQEPDEENNGYFRNVWDRMRLYFHSSLCSQTEYGFLAETKEYYYKPSKIYQYVPSGNTFSVWFSLDGKTPFDIKYINFHFCLSYILNVENSYVN